MAGPGWHLLGQEEIAEVVDVLSSREVSRYRFDDQSERSVPKVFQFEREFERLTGAKHCLGLNSGTSALLAALAALGIGAGDEVLVPGYTFIASMAAVAYSRALPVLCEIDDSLTIDPSDVARRITPRTRAILAVHMLGAPCDMAALRDICRRHGLHLIEDVAQACGGSFRGRRLGTLGDVGAFSLNMFKTITAGDGGVLITDNTTYYERAFAFHDHGSQPFRLGVAGEGSLLGLNLRMHELTGAVALAQLRKLDRILATLRAKKQLFKDWLSEFGIQTYRRLNDPSGDCGTVIAIVFRDADTANKVADALGTKTLNQSGKHYYGNMPQLLHRNMPKTAECPFHCAEHSAGNYEPGLLPRTDNLLSRTICLSVGVTDSYLGSDFGINIMSTDDDIADKAQEFHQLTRGILS